MRTDVLRVVTLLMIAASAGCFVLRKPVAPKADLPRMSPVSLEDDRPPPKITPPPMPAIPAKPTAASKDDSTLQRLARRAVENERALQTYNVRLRRRERQKNGAAPTEIMLLKFRRTPYSLHLKWLGDEAKGREIVFVQGQHEGKVHILTGRGDLFGPGFRLAFEPDSPIVRSNFHYRVQEAALNGVVSRFSAQLDAIERNQPNAGTMHYLGHKSRPEFPREMDAVEHRIPPGLESILPNGGTRTCYFDDATGLPLVVQTFDGNRREVEYYCFDRLQSPVALDDSDFDPAVLWPKR